MSSLGASILLSVLVLIPSFSSSASKSLLALCPLLFSSLSKANTTKPLKSAFSSSSISLLAFPIPFKAIAFMLGSTSSRLKASITLSVMNKTLLKSVSFNKSMLNSSIEASLGIL